MENIRRVNAIRYITPLREGGSLPALTEADDGFKYVVKFKGGGHGSKALISELIGGITARFLKLPVPELVFIYMDEAFGRTEGDEEIQDLLQASRGLNLGLHFLSGALAFEPLVTKVDPLLASKIVWLDALLMNIDRTVKNTNMLVWHKDVWLIDYGASLYFHHSWTGWEKHAKSPFSHIKDHVLLPCAKHLDEVDEAFKQLLTEDKIKEIIGVIPDEWLQWKEKNETVQDIKDVYFQFFKIRLAHSDIFVKEAQNARKTLI